MHVNINRQDWTRKCEEQHTFRDLRRNAREPDEILLRTFCLPGAELCERGCAEIVSERLDDATEMGALLPRKSKREKRSLKSRLAESLERVPRANLPL